MKTPNIKEIEENIGYRFRRKELLHQALTHSSYRAEDRAATSDNERLEFLGDAVLGLLAADHLFRNNPDMREGQLTHVRSFITNRHQLAEIGEDMHLGQFMRLGRGERASGGGHRPSILGDAVEAVLGAAYLDGGLSAALKIFQKHFVRRLESETRISWRANPKGALQEHFQRERRTSPVYRIISTEGPPHDRRFVAEVTVDGERLGLGEGHTKQAAECEAATHAMEQIDPTG